jgi:divalent metal cation (Fe/Co/Zn/Cd) transporter
MGFSYYVDLHVVVNGNLSVREGHKIAHRVEAMVLKTLPQVSEVLVHIETEKVDGDLRHHSVTVAVTNWEGREQPQP